MRKCMWVTASSLYGSQGHHSERWWVTVGKILGTTALTGLRLLKKTSVVDTCVKNSTLRLRGTDSAQAQFEWTSLSLCRSRKTVPSRRISGASRMDSSQGSGRHGCGEIEAVSQHRSAPCRERRLRECSENASWRRMLHKNVKVNGKFLNGVLIGCAIADLSC